MKSDSLQDIRDLLMLQELRYQIDHTPYGGDRNIKYIKYLARRRDQLMKNLKIDKI